MGWQCRRAADASSVVAVGKRGQPENGLFAFLQHAIQNFGARPIFGRVDVLHAVARDFDADAVAVENGFLREPCGGGAPVELPCVVPCFF